jgi:predicted MPP superfamily phosphohydrolase
VDLCVLTGDFRNAERGPFTQTAILEPLAAIRQSVRAGDGFLATLGNHDVSDMVAPFRRIGLTVLINRTHQVHRGAQALALTGIDDVHRYYTPAASAALAAHDRQAFGIALAHSPEMAGEAAAAGHDLYLCGHCHGGQVCLPGGRPVITHLSRHRDLYAGLWRYGEMWGYTSRGAGLADPPVRFNCQGEVTEFRLRVA